MRFRRPLTEPVGPRSRAFTLIECIFASAIASVSILATFSVLGFARMNNELEQQRSRAHQIVCQKLEIERYQLFTWTQTDSVQTIWDNGTLDDISDDITGQLRLTVKDPKTGDVLTSAPDPATLLEIEVTLTWRPRGTRIGDKLQSETCMTYKAP